MKAIGISSSFSLNAQTKISTFLSNFQVERFEEKSLPYEALIIRSRDLVNQNFLERFPKVKIIASSTSGFDHFDFKGCGENVVFCHSPEANAQNAAELTVFHILNFFKKGPLLFRNQPQKRSPELMSSELAGKKIALIGLGRIGTRVARFSQALGLEVLAHDPYVKEKRFQELNVTKVGFKEALKMGDIVSLHCPLTSKTAHLINKTSLSEMTSETLFVNCARGGLVDLNALIQSLENKTICGACLDVFEHEPLSKDSLLWKMPQVQLTPHIGGFSHEAHEKSALEAARQVKNWFDDPTTVLSLIPPEVEWAKDL